MTGSHRSLIAAWLALGLGAPLAHAEPGATRSLSLGELAGATALELRTPLAVGPEQSAATCPAGAATRQAASDQVAAIRARLTAGPVPSDVVVLDPHGYNYQGAAPGDPALLLYEAKGAAGR